MYTTEPHHRLFFHPLFWLMGTAARLTGCPILTVWHVVGALGCVLLSTAVYRFSACFTDDRTTRFLALALATTAAGFGWMIPVSPDAPPESRPIDLWLVEATGFQAMVSSFLTLPIALALMLWAMVWALRYLETGRLRDAGIGGLFALALAATHQYDMVTLYSVVGVWTFLVGRKRLAGMVLFVGLSIPFCFYSLAVVKLDPVLSRVRWQMDMPPPAAHVLGWGLPLLLGGVALLVPGVWRQNRHVKLLRAWLAVNVVLLLLPLGFQRKLIWGMHVVLCLLAAMLCGWLLRLAAERLRRRWLRIGLRGAAVVTLVGFCAIGSAVSYVKLLQRNTRHGFGDYVPVSYLEALHWLEQHSEPGDVVLAAPEVAPLLPGRTGNTVFEGHWAQTLDRPQKYTFELELFRVPSKLTPDMVRGVLSRNRVRYLLFDVVSARRHQLPTATPFSWADGQPSPELAIPAEGFVFAPLARLVYRNAAVIIWEVNGYRPGGAIDAVAD
jgi:hypothetical protein